MQQQPQLNQPYRREQEQQNQPSKGTVKQGPPRPSRPSTAFVYPNKSPPKVTSYSSQYQSLVSKSKNPDVHYHATSYNTPNNNNNNNTAHKSNGPQTINGNNNSSSLLRSSSGTTSHSHFHHDSNSTIHDNSTSSHTMNKHKKKVVFGNT